MLSTLGNCSEDVLYRTRSCVGDKLSKFYIWSFTECLSVLLESKTRDPIGSKLKSNFFF